MQTLDELLATYTIQFYRMPEEDGDGFVARYKELGYGVRGCGSTPDEAVKALVDLAKDGYADVPLNIMPKPNQTEK